LTSALRSPRACGALACLSLLLLLAGCSNRRDHEASQSPPVVSANVRRHLALPLYPGAQPTTNGIFIKRPSNGEIFAAYYRSPDPLVKVERYYAARMPKGSLKMFVNEADGGTADFLVQASRVQKQVVLASDRGGTLIALSATTGK
jgi:hypothetical protein